MPLGSAGACAAVVTPAADSAMAESTRHARIARGIAAKLTFPGRVGRISNLSPDPLRRDAPEMHSTHEEGGKSESDGAVGVFGAGTPNRLGRHDSPGIPIPRDAARADFKTYGTYLGSHECVWHRLNRFRYRPDGMRLMSWPVRPAWNFAREMNAKQVESRPPAVDLTRGARRFSRRPCPASKLLTCVACQGDGTT